MNTKSFIRDQAGCALSSDGLDQVGIGTQTHIGGTFDLVCRDAQGNIEWELHDVKNSMFTEGCAFLRDYLFNLNSPGAASSPQMGLSTVNGMAASVAYAALTTGEASGGSYARKAITWVGTGGPPAGANNTAAAAVWTAVSTQIVGVYELFICTGSKAIAHALLTGGPYTVNVNSTLTVTYTWSVA